MQPTAQPSTRAALAASRLAPLSNGRIGWNYNVIAQCNYHLVAECTECGSTLGVGRVVCTGCRTEYIVRRLVDHNDQVVFYRNEATITVVETISNKIRTYLPRKQNHSVTFESVEVDPTVVDLSTDPNCVICHRPMVACMSVRVSKPVFTDDDVVKQHPVTKVVYTEVVSRPSARIGRAHSECARREEGKQYGFRMVDLRVVPDKRQRSQGTRENDRLTEMRSFDQDYRVVNGEVVPFNVDLEEWE